MQQLMERLTRLEQEAAEIRAKIEAQPVAPVAPSLLTKPAIGSMVPFWGIIGSSHEPLGVSGSFIASSKVLDCYAQGNIFQSRELAKAYAEAFETFLLLRHQPGTVPAKGEQQQWIIRADDPNTLLVDSFSCLDNKISEMSPCFSSKELAQAAFNTIGAERILRMMKTFHHVE